MVSSSPTTSPGGSPIGVAIDVVRVSPADVPVVHRMLNEARSWLASRGIAQWEAPFNQQEFREAAQAGKLFLALDPGGQPVGSLQLSFESEEAWSEVAGSGGHVRRLVISRASAGSGVGGALLDWAQAEAKKRGTPELRLECAEYNQGLIAHYQKLGFDIAGYSKLTRTTDGVVMPVALMRRAH